MSSWLGRARAAILFHNTQNWKETADKWEQVAKKWEKTAEEYERGMLYFKEGMEAEREMRLSEGRHRE